MTEPQSSTMRPEIEAERDRLAAEAFDRIRRRQSLARLDVHCAGLRGRAQSSDARGAHQRAHGPRLQRGVRPLDEAATRGRAGSTRRRAIICLWVADHLPAIEAWRETLAPNQREA